MKTSVSNPVTSFELLRRELFSRGYTEDASLLPGRYTRMIAPNKRVWLTHTGLISYPFIERPVFQICRSKLLSQDFVSLHGYSVPKTLDYPAEAAQIDAFLERYKPLVAKPHNNEGSHGLTLEITSRAQLEEAIERARQYSPKVMLQQQFRGDEIRFTILRGKLVSAVLRQPARVVGDGASTLAALLEAENEIRKNIIAVDIPYPQLTNDLIQAKDLDYAAVPADGEIIRLSESSLVGRGASLYEVIDEVDETYKNTALALARALNPDMLIVDMLIADYRTSQTSDNYVFLEFNTGPVIRIYYALRSGVGYDIVPKLADMIDFSLGNTDSSDKE